MNIIKNSYNFTVVTIFFIQVSYKIYDLRKKLKSLLNQY